MKNIKYLFFTSLLVLLIFSCQRENVSSDTTIGQPLDYTIFKKGNFKSLAEIYHSHGDFINTKEFPPIILAPTVYQNSKNWLLIDLRPQEDYELGHVNGAYNVARWDVFAFLLNEQKASAYEKVIIIDHSGQMASYVTGILRYAGFDNTYVMLFGMAAWNPKFADVLKDGYGNRYSDMIESSEPIETKDQEAHGSHSTHPSMADLEKQLPPLQETYPSVLIQNRAKELLQKPREEFLVTVDELLPEIKENPNEYYTLMYLNKEKYDEGHIKGANLYNTRKDLGLQAKLTELPKDQPIIIYGKTGHTSGNAAAYLDMLGYDAQHLSYGINSFEYDASTNAIDDLLSDFPIVEGKKRTSNKILIAKPKKKPAFNKPLIKRKKKAVTGGCG